jgi:hypothetical protein
LERTEKLVVSMFCPPSAVGRWKKESLHYTQGSEHSHKVLKMEVNLKRTFVIWHTQPVAFYAKLVSGR